MYVYDIYILKEIMCKHGMHYQIQMGFLHCVQKKTTTHIFFHISMSDV